MSGTETSALKPHLAPPSLWYIYMQVEVRRCGRLNGERPEYNEETLFDRELGIDR